MVDVTGSAGGLRCGERGGEEQRQDGDEERGDDDIRRNAAIHPLLYLEDNSAAEAGDAEERGVEEGKQTLEEKSIVKGNAIHRAKASIFLEADLPPLDAMLIMRFVLEPLQRLQRAVLDMSGEAWEKRRRAKVAKALRDPHGGASRE